MTFVIAMPELLTAAASDAGGLIGNGGDGGHRQAFDGNAGGQGYGGPGGVLFGFRGKGGVG